VEQGGFLGLGGAGDTGEGAGGFLSGLDGIFTKAEQGFSSMFQSLVSSFGSILSSIGGGLLDILGFAEGSMEITRPGLAIVHSGETILPAASAGPFRAALTNPQVATPTFGSLASGGAGGGDIHIHMNSPMVGSVVSRTPKDVMAEVNKNAHAIATRIGKELAANPSIRGKY
jgi:hypothetical protein